jgi:hypothetical protein
MPKVHITKKEQAEDSQARKKQIIALIRNKPLSWAELKASTNLSSSTLFRIINKLELQKIVEQELKDKRLQWKLTDEGTKKAKGTDFSEFINDAIEVPTAGTANFDDWKPREKPLDTDGAKKAMSQAIYGQAVYADPPEGEDQEYQSLRREFINSLVTEFLGKEVKKRLITEKPLFTTVVFPTVYTWPPEKPSSAEEINGFCRCISDKIFQEREKLFLALLPKGDDPKGEHLYKTTDGAYVTQLLIAFEVELTAEKEKLEEFLEERNRLLKKEGDKTNGKSD